MRVVIRSVIGQRFIELSRFGPRWHSHLTRHRFPLRYQLIVGLPDDEMARLQPPCQEMASLARKANKHDQGGVRFDLRSFAPLKTFAGLRGYRRVVSAFEVRVAEKSSLAINGSVSTRTLYKSLISLNVGLLLGPPFSYRAPLLSTT